MSNQEIEIKKEFLGTRITRSKEPPVIRLERKILQKLIKGGYISNGK